VDEAAAITQAVANSSNAVRQTGSNCTVLRPILFLALLLAGCAATAADLTEDAPQGGGVDVSVVLDAGGQSGSASAAVRIHARREVIWPLISSCAEEVSIVPGLASCVVLETAADESWQRIRHVLNYSWYLPRLSYEVRATYAKPERITIERVSGDFLRLRGSWTLQSDGDYTIAHYAVDLVPGFWVPHWVIRGALKRDLPKMLRALRVRAESAQAMALR
jgi:Polyketide cyclase / dehydrase and lipid transport